MNSTLLTCFLALVSVGGCVPDVLVNAPDMGPDMGDPTALDPKSIFEAQAKPDLVAFCQGCHAIKQDTVQPFLARMMEYDSITGYGAGKLVTKNADDSILLQKGQHNGPALTSGQYNDVHAWLEVEAATRTGLNMNSPATPTAALGPGTFYINLEKLTGDPQSTLTFTVDERDNGAIYSVHDILITAGPFTGIHVKHPIFLLFSRMGAQKDKADSLSALDVTIMPGMTAKLDTVILTQVPRFARVAVAFEIIAPFTPDPTKVAKCKAFDVFSATVMPTLAAPCAAICHGDGAQNSAAASAQGAFNMTAASATDAIKLNRFCLQALSRVKLTDAAHSVIVLQPTPPEQGGTQNHPYKLKDAATLSAFTKAITDWAAKEK